MSRRGNQVRLGKKSYNLYRNIANTDDQMYDEYGEVVEGEWEKIKIRANIQGALIYNKQRITDSGEVSKDCISIRANERIYKARIGNNKTALQADLIEFEGALWEVREIVSYTNLPKTAHDEVYAVRVDEDALDRVKRGCIN